MDSKSPAKTELKHTFVSADKTEYHWEPRAEADITLDPSEIDDLRKRILDMSDDLIQNQESGNGIPMGVPIPLSDETLNRFLCVILKIIDFKGKLPIQLTRHAADRLADDIAIGPEHMDFRGWFKESDVDECVKTISQVDGARLTIDKRTLTSAAIFFNSEIALEVCGVKPNGTEGTLALAFVGSNTIKIITLL